MELTRKCSLAALKNSSNAMKIVDTFLKRGIYTSQRIVRDAPDRVGLSLANRAIRDAYKKQLKSGFDENEGRS